MIQKILTILSFLAACAYLLKLFYDTFLRSAPKSSCPTCGSCDVKAQYQKKRNRKATIPTPEVVSESCSEA